VGSLTSVSAAPSASATCSIAVFWDRGTSGRKTATTEVATNSGIIHPKIGRRASA